MPKLKRGFDPWERYRALLLGQKALLGFSNEDLAAKMGCSRPTIIRRLKEPGLMDLDWMRKLHRILDVPAEDARAAMPMR